MFKFIFFIILFGIVFLAGVLIGCKFNTQVTSIIDWVRSRFKKFYYELVMKLKDFYMFILFIGLFFGVGFKLFLHGKITNEDIDSIKEKYFGGRR